MSEALQKFTLETRQWFSQAMGTPTIVQEEGWPVIAAGKHALLSAPTGTGKTLAAFLVFIDRLKALAQQEQLKPEVYLIYVSPLKALGNDIRENLRRPLDGIAGADLSVGIRTGDTTNTERQRMLRRPPHILITTPESLYLLLTSKNGQKLLSTAKAIIVDEVHALINQKRGAHFMFSLARLDRLCRGKLQRIGLSATIEPLKEAAAYLGGVEPVCIVAPEMQKALDIEVNSPLPDMRVLPQGTIWPEIARLVYQHCQGARTVIAFVDGRMQAEKLAYHVNQLGGQEFARTHHGCISKEQRLEAEQELRSGQLRLLCATSSMELGIDVGEVDLVLQIGNPPTISSTMQRLGRAGHNPGRTSIMHIFPRTVAESLSCGLTARVALAGGIEHLKPPQNCLDILAQHLVSMAAVEEYTVDTVLELMQQTYTFQGISREQVERVLEMLAGDFEHAMDHPARPRVLYDRIHGTVQGDAYTRILALSSGGTIPDRGWYSVYLPDGTKLGELDEEFVFEARVGDKFLLGSFAWRITEITKDRVLVASTSTEGATPPFWKGDQIGRPYQTGLAFGALLRGLTEAQQAGELYSALRALKLDPDAATNAEGFVKRQIRATGGLPDDRTIIVEHFNDSTGENQVMVHSVFGRPVNMGLAVLMQEVAWQVTQGSDFYSFADDDGFLLYPLNEQQALPKGLLQTINPESVRKTLAALLPQTPTFNMAFRYNAGRALMLGMRPGTFGRRLPLWVQRIRSAEVLDQVVTQPKHPLIQETIRECLEDYWDLPAIEKVLQDIQVGAIQVREMHLTEPSPLSLPLRRQVESELLYSYFPTPSKVQQVVQQALEQPSEMLDPDPKQLEKVALRSRDPQNAQQAHTLLMTEGDLVAGEVDIPLQWLEELVRQKRVCYIEPGLWIAAEQQEQYQAAFTLEDSAAQQRIIRRCLRYRGPQTVLSLKERYFWDPEQSNHLLQKLVQAGEAVEQEGTYFHAELYRRAQRQTVQMLRQQVQTLPPERYAAFRSQKTRIPGAPVEQLHQGIQSLLNQSFPPNFWEEILLPTRVGGYQPEMLDTLLTQGEVFWQFVPGKGQDRDKDKDKAELGFFAYADLDWEENTCRFETWEHPLTENERKILQALKLRGATFLTGLNGIIEKQVESQALLDTLFGLMEKGLVRADSFIPVRQWLGRHLVAGYKVKQRARWRVTATMAGRWECTRFLRKQNREQAMEEALERAFDCSGILCRETAASLNWTQALETLRIWEYAGRVRRGYFIQGLSGAQFIREKDYFQMIYALEQPREEVLWMNAADPAQVWGKVLPHAAAAAFTGMSSTVVALWAGLPVAVLSRQGRVLRILEPEKGLEALGTLGRDFKQKRIFPLRRSLTIKDYPPAVGAVLEQAGFTRQMLDYEIWRD